MGTLFSRALQDKHFEIFGYHIHTINNMSCLLSSKIQINLLFSAKKCFIYLSRSSLHIHFKAIFSVSTYFLDSFSHNTHTIIWYPHTIVRKKKKFCSHKSENLKLLCSKPSQVCWFSKSVQKLEICVKSL